MRKRGCWAGVRRVLLLASLAFGALADPPQLSAQASESDQRSSVEGDTLSVQAVQRFLDPTVMISRVEYRYQANYLPGDVQINVHRFRPWVALNSWSAAWIRIPWVGVSIPGQGQSSGLGDISAGWGFMIHENLASRLTASAAGFDVLFPTGDRSGGTGFDRWILQPFTALVFNPTDLFPVFLIGRYQHSIADGPEPENGRVRNLNLSIQTFHVLPQRFFLVFIPNLFMDLQSDRTAFTFALGAGRVMTRRFALQASYVQHLSGSETISRGFQLGANYFWGPNRGR